MHQPIRLVAGAVGIALALTAAVGARAQSCPLVVDPAGGGHFTDVQPAVNHFKSNLGNLGPCTIEVRAGEYRNSVSIDGVNKNASGDAERLVIRGTRGPAQEWLSVFSTGRRDAVQLKGSRFVSIEDFEVLGGTNRPIAIEGGNAGAVNQGLTVARNNIHDNGGGNNSGCVFVADNNQDVWIVNNLCWANNSENITIGKGGAGNAVVNNTIFAGAKSGISIAKTANVVIANNLVLFSARSVGAGIDLSTSGGGTAGDRRLLHNIAYGNGSSGDITNAGSANVTSVGNQTTATLGAGLLATDFVEDPAAADFHLAGSSPALNAGIASTGTPNRVPSHDFEGDPRGDAAPDVGFDETGDADRDGVPDRVDNCPPLASLEGNPTYNPDQADRDGDGIGDVCDNCPDVHNPDQTDVTGFDAFGNPTGEPNGRGDVCEGIGESLFDVSPGPAADVVLVTTFGVLEQTETVAPTCLCNTYFYCEDAEGNPLPRTHTTCSRGIPDDLVDYAVGDQVTLACALAELFPLAAFPDGTYTCKACYSNEHRDPDLQPDGSCPSGDCVSNFEGIACSAQQTLTVDSTQSRNGCSQGYWRTHLERWSATGYATGDDFDATFGVDLFDPDVTLGEAVQLGGGHPNDLARHGTAALLNASHPGVNYAYSEEAVKALVRQGDTALLEAANSRSCPLD